MLKANLFKAVGIISLINPPQKPLVLCADLVYNSEDLWDYLCRVEMLDTEKWIFEFGFYRIQEERDVCL